MPDDGHRRGYHCHAAYIQVTPGRVNLRLLVLRHAKSVRNRPGTSDISRQLTSTGIEAAAAVGRYLKAENLEPTAVLCSPAARTRETLAHVLAAIGKNAQTRIVHEIYEAEPQDLIRSIQDHGGAASSLLLVGHNPGIELFALALGGSGSLSSALAANYPTAGLAVFDAPISEWRDLNWRGARLDRFVPPKENG